MLRCVVLLFMQPNQSRGLFLQLLFGSSRLKSISCWTKHQVKSIELYNSSILSLMLLPHTVANTGRVSFTPVIQESHFGFQSSNSLHFTTRLITQCIQKTNLSTGHVWSNFNRKRLVRQSSLFLGRRVLLKCCNSSICSRPRKIQEKTSDIIENIYKHPVYNWH